MTTKRFPLRWVSLGATAWILSMAVAFALFSEAGLPLPSKGGIPAPELDLVDLQGKRHRLSEYRGQVVLVNFWATWCPPCRREMPSIQRLWQQWGSRGIAVLAVDSGEDPLEVEQFAHDQGLGFPMLLDRDTAATALWRVRGLPTTFIVDPDGRIAYETMGGREWDAPHIVESLRRLLDNHSVGETRAEARHP